MALAARVAREVPEVPEALRLVALHLRAVLRSAEALRLVAPPLAQEDPAVWVVPVAPVRVVLVLPLQVLVSAESAPEHPAQELAAPEHPAQELAAPELVPAMALAWVSVPELVPELVPESVPESARESEPAQDRVPQSQERLARHHRDQTGQGLAELAVGLSWY